jgi:hypothetical protein
MASEPVEENAPLKLVGWSLLALAVALVRNRAWASPNLAFFSGIADHLGSNPFPKGLDGDYLLTNLLGPTVARALGQTAPHEYARLHLGLLVVGLGLVTVGMYRRDGYRPARALVWILAASPAVSVCLQWLGQPDALTLPLAMSLVLVRRRWAGFAFAVLLGLAHPEQGLVAAVVATIAASFCGGTVTDVGDETPTERCWRWGLALVGGVAVGRGITEVYLRVNDIVVTRPRTSYLDLGFDGFVDHHLTSPLALLYSLWGPLWLVLGWLTWTWWRSPDRDRAWPIVLLTALGALVPVALTLDETRVYALTTAPLLVVIAVRLAASMAPTEASSPSTSPSPVRIALATVGVLALALVPGMFSAGDDYWAPALPPGEFAAFLADGSVPGGPDQLTVWLLGPFGFEVPTAG